MTNLVKTLSFVALIGFGGAAFAQTTDTPAPTDTPTATITGAPEAPADPLALSMGNEGPVPGDVYVEATFSDWELRCIKSEGGGVDPCQLYQLLKDPKGNPVAEINIFPLPAGQEVAAGATVITPLETLLTQALAMSVDGSAPKKYPFSWCSTVGCFARMGFAEADIKALKRGVLATLTIVPVAAPDQRVSLKVSLNGFTAAFDAASARLAK